MKKTFNAKIDELMKIKSLLDSANSAFLHFIIDKNELEEVGVAIARHAQLDVLAAKVEKYKPIKGAKVQAKQAQLFGDAVKNLMLTQKAYEAGITTINSTFDAYVKMTFDFEAKEVEKAYAEIRKRSHGKASK